MDSEVARVFDAMAGSYDELEPWYEHLYRRLHATLRAELAVPADGGRPRALDAGCGTGFQTAILGDLGYECHGLDLSPGLLAVARQRLTSAALTLGTIEALPYPDDAFDVVSCCGSTLSFVSDPARALWEIGRVLRPGGRLVLECEHKWSLDLGWGLVSALTGDSLGYGLSPATVWKQLWRPLREGFHLDYPCGAHGELMRIRLFTVHELRSMLAAVGIVPRRWWGVHALTNLIPSTVLHRTRLPRPLATLYRGLCAIDGAIGGCPGRWIANTLVVLGRKEGPAS